MRVRLVSATLPVLAEVVEDSAADAAFADQQVYRNEQGWRIVRSEVEVTAGRCIFDVDGQPFFLTGRIDRIDQHEVSGAWAIWDYKTSDSGYPPERTHRKRDEWIDLQLPLYRYLAAHVDEGTKSILDVDKRHAREEWWAKIERLSSLTSRALPNGTSAVEAVQEQRRDL